MRFLVMACTLFADDLFFFFDGLMTACICQPPLAPHNKQTTSPPILAFAHHHCVASSINSIT
jgi:hypothetical protein